MAYTYETTIDHIVEQAEVGVRPLLKDLLAKRLQEAADEALAKAKADIDEAIKDIAYKIADGLEAQIVSFRSASLAEPDFQITVLIDRKKQTRTELPKKSRVE